MDGQPGTREDGMSWHTEFDSLASDPCDKSDKIDKKGFCRFLSQLSQAYSGKKWPARARRAPRIQPSPKLKTNRSIPDGGQAWHPTKKGVSLKRELLSELVEALRAAEKGD